MEDLISLFIIAFSHITNHFLQPFVGLMDVHTIPDRILADPDLLRQIVFVDPVDSFIVQDADNFQRMGSDMKLGFIGTGNMASAIMGGIIKNQVIAADEIIGADLFAPGKTLAWLKEQFGKEVKIVRTMPNTPAMVGAGMTAACPNENMKEDEIAYVKTLLESFGRVEIVPERLMDVVVSTSGSSPAYVFMLIEAMADAAVSGGMPRPQAYQFAAQAVMGSAKMVLDTGKHPGELKDMVCSPAGTTIEAVRVLEERGFRSAVFEAMKVCEEMSKSM